MLFDNTTRTYTSSRPNFIQRRPWANPCSLILNIEGATTDHYYAKCIGNSKKKYVPVIRKNAMLYNNTPHMYASSRPNFTQRKQWANSCSLILNIEGATDHYRLRK